MDRPCSAGQAAYEAYVDVAGGVSLVPDWSELKPEIRSAWASAAFAAINHGSARDGLDGAPGSDG